MSQFLFHSGSARIAPALQSAPGTVGTSPLLEARVDEGTLGDNRQVGRKTHADAKTHGGVTHYASSVGGEVGNQTQEATIRASLVEWVLAGGEVEVLTPPVGETRFGYRATPGNRPMVHSIYQYRGVSPDDVNEVYADCYTNSITMESSAGEKPMSIEKSVISLDPSIYKTAAFPTAQVSNDQPFPVHYNGEFTFALLGEDVSDTVTGWSVEYDRALTPQQASRLAYSRVNVQRASLVNTITCLWDELLVALLKKQRWGSATPAEGDKPTAEQLYGSFAWTIDVAGESLTFEMPKVHVGVFQMPGISADGDAQTGTLALEAVDPDDGGPLYTVEAWLTEELDFTP